MQFSRLSHRLLAASAAISLCAMPVAARSAAVAPAPAINPLVALSIFGSQASATALCGTAAAAAAATTAQAAQPGCVLPAVDAAPPPPPVADVAPVLPPPSGGLGIGIAPILLGLAGIAILAALISGNDDRSSDDTPVSPS